MTRWTRIPVWLAASLLFASVACGPIEDLVDLVEGRTPREGYVASLREVGLDETALGKEWLRAGERALREAVAVETPFREAGYLPADRPSAVGYRVFLRRGQVLRAELRVESREPVRIFLDLHAPETGEDSVSYRHVTSGDTVAIPAGDRGDAGDAAPGTTEGLLRLEHEAPRDGAYVLRVQPELLRSGRYTLELATAPSFDFPVSGHDSRAIRSGFGAPREAGRRTHHGVDIFAPRGTPAVAATAGRVARVGRNRLGGNIVWLRDADRPQSLYYAHLDTQLVRAGERVRRGDTLGLVGNSGNARTTPPHLHFGIYRSGEGPVDPFGFLDRPPQEPPPVTADIAPLGDPVRLAARTHLRAAPRRDAGILDTLDRHTLAHPVAAAGGWYRVRLPDGRSGYVHGGLVERADRATGRALARGSPLLEAPAPGAVAVDTLPTGEPVPVFGRFGEFLYVQVPGGRSGWLPARG